MNEKMTQRFELYRKYLGKSSYLQVNSKEDLSNDVSVMKGVSENVLAPSLISFIIWVLKQAINSKTDRLYFLARDGYLMYQIALVLCNKLNLPIECRYLYCSRYSLRIPLFHLYMDEALEYICRGGIDVTMEKILNRAGIPDNRRREVLNALDYIESETAVIPYAELKELKLKLKDCKLFLDIVEEQSKERLPAIQRYFMQEGLLDGGKYAFVDSGWVGSVQKSLNQLLTSLGNKREIKGYYWGLYELPQNVRAEDYYSYYFGPKDKLKEKVYFSNCLFEAVFSAPHGMTLDYQIQEGKILPVLDRCPQDRKVFMMQTEYYLISYAEQMTDRITDIRQIDCEKNKKIVYQLLKKFMGNPSKAEAEFYGSLGFSDDVLDDFKHQVAAPLNDTELCANHVGNKILVMLGIRKSYIKESAWYEGSVARNGQHNRRHWFSYAIYKYLLYIRKMYT